MRGCVCVCVCVKCSLSLSTESTTKLSSRRNLPSKWLLATCIQRIPMTAEAVNLKADTSNALLVVGGASGTWQLVIRQTAICLPVPSRLVYGINQEG